MLGDARVLHSFSTGLPWLISDAELAFGGVRGKAPDPLTMGHQLPAGFGQVLRH